ncbi:MAG TPA: histidine kinase dimerization/phospho-acceptor domain-containing protein [Spirochaetota bacterium]|nr:histidine kinase dimerization/phospho-acceptor domain-containing protein [Spirochaetota bacterium]
MNFDKHTIELINRLHEGVLVLDEQKNVIVRNRAAETLLGLKIRPRHKINIKNLFQSRNPELYRFLFQAFQSCDNHQDYEIVYHKKSRAVRLLVSTYAHWEGDSPREYFFFIILRDITEVWRLVRREKHLLVQLGRSYMSQMENLRQIAQSVAHEVRNPIVSIGGYTNLMLKKLDAGEERPENFRNFLNIIHSDTERLHRIVDQVEKYSDASEISLRKENIVNLFRQMIEYGKKLSLEHRVTFDAPAINPGEYHIYVDRARLKLGLYNLVRHSILLSRSESRLKARLNFTPFEVDFMLDIRTDMQKEETLFLFNPFYSTSNRELNFDLALTQRIVMQHGGVIRATWKPESILRLHLSIPREKRLDRDRVPAH